MLGFEREIRDQQNRRGLINQQTCAHFFYISYDAL